MNLGFLTSSLLNYCSHCPLCSRVIVPPRTVEFSHGVSTPKDSAVRACWTGCVLGKLDVESGQGLPDEKDGALGSTD